MEAGARQVDAEIPPLIVADDGFPAAFIEVLARTEGPDTDGGDCTRSSCIGLAIDGKNSAAWIKVATTTSRIASERSGRRYAT